MFKLNLAKRKIYLGIKTLVFLLAFIIVPVALAQTANYFAGGSSVTGYRATIGVTGGLVNIWNGSCKKIINTSVKELFIPTKNQADWNAFVAHLPAGVSIGDCTCGAGFYRLAGVCVLTSPGYYSPANDDNQYPCTAGYYCTAGSSSPTQNTCACSTYSGAAAASCTLCTDGYCCATANTSATSNVCTLGYNSTPSSCSYTCGSGYYDSNRDAACEVAGAGYYSPLNDYRKYSCIAGYYGSTSTNSVNTCDGTCAAGRWGSAGQINNQCSGACTAGYYCSAGSTSATQNNCGAGNYCPTGSVDNSLKCLAGYYGSSVNNSVNTCNGQCACGYFGNAVGQTTSSCNGQCVAGKYSVAGAGSCSNCSANTSSSAGSCSSGACVSCSAGYISVAGGTCYTCGAGYDDYAQAGFCSVTAAGYYSPANDYQRYACPAGTYGSTAGLTNSACTGQISCGYYGGLAEISATPAGKTCTAGYYCLAGSISATQNNCGGGYWCAATACNHTACAVNTFSSAVNAISSATCTACANGTFSVAGSTSCGAVVCAAGYYAVGTVCATCGSGYSPSDNYYSPGGAVTSCTQVSPGYYSTGGTSTTRTGQTQCQAGTYCSSGLQSNCPAGTYGSTAGLTTSACTGQTSCGYYGGLAETSATPAGKTCTAGYYCSAGSTSATQNNCGAGNYCPAVSCNNSNKCIAGYYGSSLNNSVSTCDGACAAGRYGSTSGQTTNQCTGACACGYYGNSTGQTTSSCNGQCAAGTHSVAGSTSCSNCAADTSSTAGTCTSCTVCATGYTAQAGGVCYTCGAGYDDYAKAGFCSLTPAGYYSPINDYQRYNCGGGHYCAAGSGSPTDCPVNTYSAATNNTVVGNCTACGNCSSVQTGYYTNGSTGQTTCTPFGCSGEENAMCVNGYRTCQNMCPGGIDNTGSDSNGNGFNDAQELVCGQGGCKACTSGPCCNTTTACAQPNTVACSGSCASTPVASGNSCTYTYNNTKCNGSETATCTGSATASGATCNCPNGQVWNGSACAAASATVKCGTGSTYSCLDMGWQGINSVVNNLACNGSGTCNVNSGYTTLSQTCTGSTTYCYPSTGLCSQCRVPGDCGVSFWDAPTATFSSPHFSAKLRTRTCNSGSCGTTLGSTYYTSPQADPLLEDCGYCQGAQLTGSLTCTTTTCGAGYQCSGSAWCGCCPVGTYSQGGTSFCQNCSPGYWSGTCSPSCTMCSAGGYCDSSGFHGCPAGKTSNPGSYYQSQCFDSACPVGHYITYSPYYCWPAESACVGTVHDVWCIDCAAGSWGTGSTETCNLCAIGTYQASTGSGMCNPCPSGWTTASTGSTSNTQCNIVVGT